MKRHASNFLKKGILTILTGAFMSAGVMAQLAPQYPLTISTGTYSSISGTGTSVATGDDVGTNITGFTGFTVNSVTYTNARMCSNGWLALYGATAPTATTNYTTLSTAMPNGAVIFAPFGRDLNNNNGGTAWWQTIGNEVIFEWKNFNRYGQTDVLNFQIRLNTSTGDIKFVYGTMTPAANTTYPQVGWKTNGTVAANWSTDINNVMIDVTGSPATCNWSNVVTGNLNTSTCYFNSANAGVVPPSGLTYTWTKPNATDPNPVRTFSAVANITSNSADLSWTAPTGATQYNIQYRAVGSCTWTNFSGNPVSGTSATLTGLSPATTYQIRVQSGNGSVNGLWSHIPNQAGTGNGYLAAGTFTTLAVPCSGVPAPGNTISSANPVCSGVNFTLSLQFPSTATGLTYQWQSADDAAFTIGLTNLGTTSTQVTSQTAAKYYRCNVTCTNSGLSAYSTALQVTMNPPTYATYNNVSYAESFESWVNGCSTSDRPSAAWENSPYTGNASWRRNDQGSTAAWTTPTSGVYSPVFTDGSYSARFHTYDVSSGTKGSLSLYINMTAATGNTRLSFDHINTSGTDVLKVFLSTDGGLTFTQQGADIGVSATWTNKTFDFNSTSATTVIKLEATSDYGLTDIGIDKLKLEPVPSCFPPTSLTGTPTSYTTADISWTAPLIPPANGYEYWVSTSPTPPVVGTPYSGTNTSVSGLTANTTYYLHVRSLCGTGDTSVWVTSPSFITGYCQPVGNTNYYLTNVVTTGGTTNFTNTTGASPGGYADYSASIYCANKIGIPTSITLTPNTSTHYFYCWIDWNNDFDFNDPNETIFATSSYTSNYTGTINIPLGTPDGTYRMRVAQSYIGVITACGPSSYGEYEDYSFKVVSDCSGAPTAGNITGVNTVCSGQGTTLTLSGASEDAGITYQWSVSAISGGPYTNLGTNTTQATGPLLADAYYIVTVTCANSGLFATTTEKQILVNPSPIVAVTPDTALFCSPGPAVTLTASGAVTYAWSPAIGLSDVTGSPVDANPASTTTYTVVGTGGNGCTASATAYVRSALNPTITSITATPAAVCVGGNSQLDADANSNILFPINQYAYTYSTGASMQNMTGATTIVISGVDDAPSSLQNIGFTFYYEGVPYTQFSASPDGFLKLGSPVAVDQYTNTITSTTNIPKIYAYWDDMATGTDGNIRYLLTGTPGNQICVVEWFVTIPRNISGSANSRFQVWLYEATGVIELRYGTMGTASMSASVGATGATATNYQSITVTTNTASISTENNSVANQPASGTMYRFTPNNTLTYSWTPSTYLSSTTISNPMANNVIAPINYLVTVTNIAGCTDTASISVNLHPVMIPSIVVTNTTCAGNDGALDLTVSGGTPSSYLWSNAATTEDISNLSVGTYTVTISDVNSCTVTASATIVNGSGFSVSGTAAPVSCFGGSDGAVDITVSGGLSPYSYSWSNTATTEDISGLTAGTYTVTVTDDASCTISQSFTVIQPTAITANMIITDVDCNGNNNGDVSVMVGGGVAPYSYLWNTGGTTSTLNTVNPGWYTVTITDDNLCIKIDSAYVDEPAALTSVITPTQISCFGYNNGAADLTSGGGVTPYSYTWSNSASSEDISSLAPGTYTVTILDDNGCSLIDSVTITEPSALTHTLSSTNVLCYGDANGTATVTPTGGTTPYGYLWSDNQTTSTAVNLPSGTYSVTITDANGCTNYDAVTITEPLMLTASITASSDVTCFGANDGTATVVAGYGTPGYTYVWSNNNTSDITTGLAGGTYTVTVTDANGCTATDMVSINEPTEITSTAIITDETWGNDGTIDISPSGGNAPYTFNWSTGATTEDIGNLAGGTYTVTITDASGCTASFTYTVVSYLGINGEEAGIGNVNFYPNPSNGQFNITITGVKGNNIQMQILDISGKVVYVTELEHLTESYVTTIDLRHLSMGTYMVRLISDTGTLTGRIVITQ